MVNFKKFVKYLFTDPCISHGFCHHRLRYVDKSVHSIWLFCHEWLAYRTAPFVYNVTDSWKIGRIYKIYQAWIADKWPQNYLGKSIVTFIHTRCSTCMYKFRFLYSPLYNFCIYSFPIHLIWEEQCRVESWEAPGNIVRHNWDSLGLDEVLHHWP